MERCQGTGNRRPSSTTNRRGSSCPRYKNRQLEEPIKVYNLEIDGYHVYFVGSSRVLVHNECKEVEYKGKKVIQDDGLFDPNAIDKEGRTNIQRMKDGLAPKGYDGNSVNIHHIDQIDDGPLMEILANLHRKYSRDLHDNVGQEPSKIVRSTFNAWRRSYWKWRAKGFE